MKLKCGWEKTTRAKPVEAFFGLDVKGTRCLDHKITRNLFDSALRVKQGLS